MKKLLLFFIALSASLSINAAVVDTVRISLKMPVTEKFELKARIDTTGLLPLVGGVKDTIFWLGEKTTSYVNVLDTTFVHPMKSLNIDNINTLGFTNTEFYVGSLYINQTNHDLLHPYNPAFPINPSLTNGSIDTLYYFKWYQLPLANWITNTTLKISGTTNRTQVKALDEGESFKVGFNFGINEDDIQFVKLYKNDGTLLYTGKTLDSILVNYPTYSGIIDTIRFEFGNWEDTIKYTVNTNRLFYRVYKPFDFTARYTNKQTADKPLVGTNIVVDAIELPIVLYLKASDYNPSKVYSPSNNQFILGTSVVSSNVDTVKIDKEGDYVLFYKVDGVSYSKTYKVTVNQPTAYSLTVVDGKILSPIGGSYVPGTDVKVAADKAPDGYYFDKWTESYNLDFEAYKDTITYKMPAGNVVLTANYCELPIYTFNGNLIKDSILTIHSAFDVNKLFVNGQPVVKINQMIQDSIACFSTPDVFNVVDTFTNACGKVFITPFKVTVSTIYLGIDPIAVGSVYASNGQVVIALNNVFDVKIYNIFGSLVYSAKTQNEIINLSHGVYIVVVGGNKYKIMI